MARSSLEVEVGVSLTCYLVVDNSVGKSSINGELRCGARCEGCYLIDGGVSLRYKPSVDEVIQMINSLEAKRVRVILTGAELLARPDLFEAGLMNDKEYLLTSGKIIAEESGEEALRLIDRARIRNITMSWHPVETGGIGRDIVAVAIKKIRAYFGSRVGVGLNLTVRKSMLERLENELEKMVEIGVNGVRLNRYKAHGGVSILDMLNGDDIRRVAEIVDKTRKKYPTHSNGPRISISGDFGNLGGTRNYSCPAGLVGGEVTIVPQKTGKHLVFPCLESRLSDICIGEFDCTDKNRTELKLKLNLLQDVLHDGCLSATLLSEKTKLDQLTQMILESDFDTIW